MTWPRLRIVLARLALLCALAFVLDRVVAFACGEVLLRAKSRYSMLYRGGAQADVVVLGNSRGVNGFYAPALETTLGSKVVNLAYNGLSPVVEEALARDWVERNAKPKLLVLEVSNVGDGDSTLEALAPYWSQSARLTALAEATRPRTVALQRIAHLLTFNGETFLRGLYYLRRSDQDWINRYRITPELVAATETLAPFAFAATEENLSALARIVGFAREQGISTRLVVTPYLPAYVRRATGYTEWIARIERATGEKVWDAGASDSEPEHFADRLHMNDRGAAPLAARLYSEGFFNVERPAGLEPGGVSGARP